VQALTPTLLAFRRRPLENHSQDVLPALFILESSMHLAAGVVASWAPSAMLQVFGVADHAGVAAVRATVEHAVAKQGVRTIVVCAEGSTPPEHGRGSARLLDACGHLTNDQEIGALLRPHGIAIEAMWFDTLEGDVHLWDSRARRFEILADSGLARFFGDIAARRAARP